jgi:hypothetical protein
LGGCFGRERISQGESGKLFPLEQRPLG